MSGKLDPEKEAEFERKVIEWLENLPSSEDLKKQLGEITPEERAMLDQVDWNAPITEEELRAIGPDFTEKLLASLRESWEKEDKS